MDYRVGNLILEKREYKTVLWRSYSFKGRTRLSWAESPGGAKDQLYTCAAPTIKVPSEGGCQGWREGTGLSATQEQTSWASYFGCGRSWNPSQVINKMLGKEGRWVGGLVREWCPGRERQGRLASLQLDSWGKKEKAMGLQWRNLHLQKDSAEPTLLFCVPGREAGKEHHRAVLRGRPSSALSTCTRSCPTLQPHGL